MRFHRLFFLLSLLFYFSLLFYLFTCSLSDRRWWQLHAAGQTEDSGDGGEDGDNHVDDHLPGFFLVFEGHSLNQF